MSASDRPRLSLRPSFWPERPKSNPEQIRTLRRRAWADARGALPATLVVHGLTLALASWPALALQSAIAGSAGPSPVEQGVLLDLIRHAREAGLAGSAMAVAAAGLLSLLLAIPVQLGWVAALAGERPAVAVRLAFRRTPVAAAVTGGVGVLALIAIVLGALPALLLHLGFAGDPDARLHDVLVLAALVAPTLIFAAAWATLDLARAASLRLGPWESLKRAWWALRPAGATYAWVLTLRLALGLPLLFLPLPPIAALLVFQLAALASTGLRSRWLAEARLQVQTPR